MPCAEAPFQAPAVGKMARAAEWQSAMAAATAFAFPNSTGIFSTLGGSNTLGACDTAGKLRCNQAAFFATHL